MKLIKAKAFICTFIMTASMFGNVYANVTPAAQDNSNDSSNKAFNTSDEYLSRGVVAVRTGNNIFVSWRLLASDKGNCAFNVYRKVDDSRYERLNSEPLLRGTNYMDTTADITKSNTYYVEYIKNMPQNGKVVEQAVYCSVDEEKNITSANSYTVAANTLDGPVVIIPIKDGTIMKNVWTADFNGDGNYDYLVDRPQDNHQLLEAYLNDGTYLWTIDLGINSENKNNISPGASTIDVGHWDGVTVYDMDKDGKAEVMLRIANGVTFGDGTQFSYDDNVHQWIAIIDGMTGVCEDKAEIPDDYISIGSVAAQFGIGYLDGKKPSLVSVMKNRNTDKSFNLMICSYSYQNGKFKMDWKFNRGDQAFDDGHQMRIADVDYDGKDEILEIGFCLNGDGTLRYSLSEQGIVHGDRFYVGKFNKDDEVMMGYGIQQNNPNLISEYYYNASTGEVIWKHLNEKVGDTGRGAVGDIDPTKPGFEVWSFSGIYNGATNELLTAVGKTMWPAISFQWDGDLLIESYNNGKIEQWHSETNTLERLVTCSDVYSNVNDYNNVFGYGDFFGDWREEVITTNDKYNELVIYTTNIPTDYRLTCLAQDRSYRNCMTIKGYKQSHELSYYLGSDMDNESTN